MSDLVEQIADAERAIRARWAGQPVAGIILGTGLGALAQDIQAEITLPYADIPHFPHSTVQSHAGRLVCGQLNGKTVVAMEGRFHAYEGYSLRQITFPVRVFKALGCRYLIVSNACGGMNPQYAAGDLMLIEDHINLLGDNPLIGPNDDRLGERFPDMSQPYDKDLLKLVGRIAREEQIVRRGAGTEPGDAGRVSLPARHRGRRGGHVYGPGGDRGRPRQDAVAGHLGHHRHVPAGRPEAGEH